MDEYDLRLCPFCGGEPKIVTISHNGNSYVKCKSCGAQGPVRYEEYEAVGEWNENFPARSHYRADGYRDKIRAEYKKKHEESVKKEAEAYRAASKALERAQRIDKHNRSLINTHNALMSRIEIAVQLLESRLNQKPKHLLTRGADGKLVGDDRDTILKVIECLRPKQAEEGE